MHVLEGTKGVVLSKRVVGEANVLVYILTEKLGLIRAQARSARKEESKLRYALEPMTSAKFTFVRGRYEWKLVGAENVSHLFTTAPTANRKAAGRIAKLLTRLVSGEEPVEELYTTVAEGLSYLARAADASAVEGIECVLVLRILSHLGYLPTTRELAPFIEADFFSVELSAEVARSRALIIRTINESLGATGL